MVTPYVLENERSQEGMRPPTEAERTTVQFALMKMLDIVNALPEEVKASVIVSFITTICMNADDPKDIRRQISDHTSVSVAEFTAEKAEPS